MRTNLVLSGVALVAAAVMSGGVGAAQAAPASPASYSNCLSGDFCAYSGTQGTGTKKAYYICRTIGRPFNTVGSLYNHQTGGAVVTIYYSDGSNPVRVPAGAHWDMDWRPVSKIKTC